MKYLDAIGYVLLVAGILCMLLWPAGGPWIFSVGAAMVAIDHLTQAYKGNNLRLRRMSRIRAICGICYVIAAFYVFRGEGRYWLPVTIVGAVLELYSQYVITKENRKDNGISE
jgi:hypothetical protein